MPASIQHPSFIGPPLRRAVFSHIDLPGSVQHALDPGMTWDGWRLPGGLELALVALAGAVILTVAIVRFSRTE